MFTSFRTEHTEGFIEYRVEDLTGLRTRICPERLKRGIGGVYIPTYKDEDCPFCPGLIEEVTPVFPDGKRIHIGESITFPNLYPFAAYHVVTSITHEHSVPTFTHKQIADALSGQVTALKKQSEYVSINWNYLPSAGASLPHPHLQGLCDHQPDTLPSRYLLAGEQYHKTHGRGYFEDVRKDAERSGRDLPGTILFWYAHPVPIGEREIRCLLPLTTVAEFSDVLEDFAADLISLLGFYRDLGTSAFNMAIFFGQNKDRNTFSAFCSLISRINPNPLSTSDTAFMERLHLEPVILTLPEELASTWREYAQNMPNVPTIIN
ncbi:galactose-1-phosphate uridylyltransferase [Methanospirillum lacunae]|uniref:Galactose-1-phosphate uridylyltransferase n=1 Tax=Methanospirillum lacunae TaxID=668570 RepID=A0A2V2N690_9EURY|nr:galactose-1-phosphate uridylyltransferase [Methanospirillum lacunae]PWR71031.1 galactose-1-phosphate uridylyltransferase [Methanospirillum lacunae]